MLLTEVKILDSTETVCELHTVERREGVKKLLLFLFFSTVANVPLLTMAEEVANPSIPVWTNCKAVQDGLVDRCIGEISPQPGGHIVRYEAVDTLLANGIILPEDRETLDGCVAIEMFFFSNWTGWNSENGTARIPTADTPAHTIVIPGTPREGAGYWAISFNCSSTEAGKPATLVTMAFNNDWWASPVEASGFPWAMSLGDAPIYPGLAVYGAPTRPNIAIVEGFLRVSFKGDIMSALVLKGNERYGTRRFEIEDCALNFGSTGWETATSKAGVRAIPTTDDRGYVTVDFPMGNIPRNEWGQFSCRAKGTQTTLNDGSVLWANISGFDFGEGIQVDTENGLFSIP